MKLADILAKVAKGDALTDEERKLLVSDEELAKFHCPEPVKWRSEDADGSDEDEEPFDDEEV